jgi:predicted transcriptional regulator
MNLTIELSDEKAAALRAQAEARGLTVERWVEQIAEQHAEAQPASIAHLQKTNPKEWARRFHEWAESHDRTTPLLSDEAISRESIYPDRI